MWSLGQVTILVVGLLLQFVDPTQQEITCCQYCRSEPRLWYSIQGAFVLSTDHAKSAMTDPPAFLVDDVQTAEYQLDSRDYKLHYAGAPLKLKHLDLSDQVALMAEQYVQVDLASPKLIGGVLTQGGFYEEKAQGFFPYKDGWVTDYVLSYSNDSETFYMYTAESGATQLFQGNEDMTDRKVGSFSRPVYARYVRFHPLRAQNDDGALFKVNVRVTVITCGEGVCFTPRINCLLSQWTTWSDCTCNSDRCVRSRDRSIRRVQACGGAQCEDTLDTDVGCTPETPTWQTVMMYVGIVLAVIVVIIIIALLIHKKTHRDRVEVIVVKDDDHDQKPTFRPGPAARTPFGAPRAGPPPPGGALPRQPMPMGGRTGYGRLGGMGGVAPTDGY